MSNKKLLIGSIATVVAAGTIGASVANTHLSKSYKRKDVKSALERGGIVNDFDKNHASGGIQSGDVAQDLVIAKSLHKESSVNEASLDVNIHKGIRNAIASGSWQDFQDISSGKKISRLIDTSDKFDAVQEVRYLRSKGRYSEAREIMGTLGLLYEKTYLS